MDTSTADTTGDSSTMERRSSASPADMASVRATISPVMLRTITGAGHASNRRALDWGDLSGLVAYGSNTLVVVVDPVSLQVVQVLEKHRSSVVSVKWTKAPTKKHPADRLTLATSDATGHIVVWNVKSGEVKALMQEGNKPVTEMEWCDGSFENSGHLLAAMHPPFSFVLWDTSNGTAVWKKTYTETLQSFDFDPFDPAKIAFRCIECILFVEDFSPTRVPSSSGKKFYVDGPARGSPSRNSLDASGIPSSTSTSNIAGGEGGRFGAA